MPGTKFRVLTLNTLFRPAARARLRAIALVLNESGVDFICLQEVVLRANARLIQQSLTEYRATAYATFGIWIAGGLVSLARRSIDRTTHEVFERRGEWWSRGVADRSLRKGFLSSWITIDGLQVVVINTHLLANYDEDPSPGNRYARHQKAELDQLAGAVQAIDAEALVIVSGDLNVLPTSPVFAAFMKECGLLSVFAPAPAPPTYRRQGLEGADLALDHILYRPPVSRLVTAVDAKTRFEPPVLLGDGRKTFASDHLAVEAEFQLDGPLIEGGN